MAALCECSVWVGRRNCARASQHIMLVVLPSKLTRSCLLSLFPRDACRPPSSPRSSVDL